MVKTSIRRAENIFYTEEYHLYHYHNFKQHFNENQHFIQPISLATPRALYAIVLKRIIHPDEFFIFSGVPPQIDWYGGFCAL